MTRKLKRSILYWALLSPIVVVTLFPFAVMFITAIKPAGEMLSPRWWPHEPAFGNFIAMIGETNFGQALLNSLIVAVSTTVITILIAIPGGYALSRYRFGARSAFRQFLLISQMLSPIVLVIGLFRLIVWLGLVDRLGGLILVYSGFNVAFAVWMLASYFGTIPKDLEEAAWIEGASPWRTLVSVFLPLAVPAMVVTAIFTFIASWNEFIVALTILRSPDGYTLPLQIFSLVSRYTVEWNYVMAAAFAATIPVAIVFAWLQRYLMRGLALGAVK